MTLLVLGSSGARVTALQQRLQQRGFDPGAIKGQFGAATELAVKAFQNSVGLRVDGQAGPNTIAALALPSVTSNVTPDLVAQMFPATPRLNIQFHLPFVLKALHDAALADKSMLLMALGTIRAETASFLPIDEFESRFNTTPGGPHPFDKYDYMTELGNQGPPDGANFKGRGFVQLTGRANYTQFSTAIGLADQLVQDPDLAGDPTSLQESWPLSSARRRTRFSRPSRTMTWPAPADSLTPAPMACRTLRMHFNAAIPLTLIPCR